MKLKIKISKQTSKIKFVQIREMKSQELITCQEYRTKHFTYFSLSFVQMDTSNSNGLTNRYWKESITN